MCTYYTPSIMYDVNTSRIKCHLLPIVEVLK